MSTPLNRFNAWLRGEKAPGMTHRKAIELAEGLGHSTYVIQLTEYQIQHWLAANETEKKANKRYWGKFMLNWLKPKSSRQQGRLEPSDFN